MDGKQLNMSILTIEDFMVKTKVCESKREAKELHKQEALYINKEKVLKSHTHVIINDEEGSLLLNTRLISEEEFNDIKF